MPDVALQARKVAARAARYESGIRRCRRKCRLDRIRRMAPSSISISLLRPRRTSRSKSWIAGGNWCGGIPPTRAGLRRAAAKTFPIIGWGTRNNSPGAPAITALCGTCAMPRHRCYAMNIRISALYGNTPGLPLGAMATPGNYRVRLTVNSRSFEQPLVVGMDPRRRCFERSLDAATGPRTEDYRPGSRQL